MTSILTGIFASQISGHLYGGPVGAYDSLATITAPSGGLTSVTFAGIPAGYTHLQIRAITLTSGVNTDIVMRFNGDSGNNYSQHYLYGSGAGAGAGAVAPGSYATLGIEGGTSNPSASVCDILDYNNTNKNKTVRALSGIDQNGSGYLFYYSSAWYNTAAITSIAISPGAGVFNANCSFALYGVK